ncbi:MAG: hypothetical protein BYD32DRAFT_101792 [Podila humilis]|nr:MAG: hypothetical protein BYD32DRAFT_101792 [Podila humilis]
MSRLLSSSTPSFAQAAYTPLVDSSRHSQDTPEGDDDLDPDSSSSSNHRYTASSSNNYRQTSSSSAMNDPKHDSSDTKEDEDNDQMKRDPFNDSATILVESSDDSPSSPPPKYALETFEYAEPGHDRPRRGPDEETGGQGAQVGNGSEGHLWMQVRSSCLSPFVERTSNNPTNQTNRTNRTTAPNHATQLIDPLIYAHTSLFL